MAKYSEALSTKSIPTADNYIRTGVPKLSKKSTALDVLKELNNYNCLAPYVNENSVAVITGGSGGIGLCTVEALSLTGMRVVLCARDVEAAEKVINDLTQKDNIRIQKLDLSDLNNIKEACEEIISTEGSIDVLLNNAGVMAIPNREETKEGFEMQLGVNHIGHFMFSRLLLPHINKGGRVVTVASTAHEGGDIDKGDINYSEGRQYTPWGAYSQSKLANILFAKGLQDKVSNTKKDIISLSLHPGVIKTSLWRNTPKAVQLISGVIADKTSEQGAATNVYASLIRSETFNGGEYLADCKIKNPNKKGEDEDGNLRDWLWTETEKLIAEKGFILPDM